MIRAGPGLDAISGIRRGGEGDDGSFVVGPAGGCDRPELPDDAGRQLIPDPLERDRDGLVGVHRDVIDRV